MTPILLVIEIVAMIVTAVLILLFFGGQVTHLLTPDLQAFAVSANIWWGIVVGAILVEGAKLLRKTCFEDGCGP